MEYALIACRQYETICSDYNVSISSSAVVTKTVTGLVNTEKCSWGVKVTTGAPYFKINSTASEIINSGYDIHYIEHDETVQNNGAAGTSSNAAGWISLTSTTSNMNVLYNKEQFNGMEYAYFEQKYTDSSTSLQYRRYFPAHVVDEMIDEQNTKNTAYTTLLTAYNASVAAYNIMWTNSKGTQPVIYPILEGENIL